jgi:hypothetical protein
MTVVKLGMGADAANVLHTNASVVAARSNGRMSLYKVVSCVHVHVHVSGCTQQLSATVRRTKTTQHDPHSLMQCTSVGNHCFRHQPLGCTCASCQAHE